MSNKWSSASTEEIESEHSFACSPRHQPTSREPIAMHTKVIMESALRDTTILEFHNFTTTHVYLKRNII